MSFTVYGSYTSEKEKRIMYVGIIGNADTGTEEGDRPDARGTGND